MPATFGANQSQAAAAGIDRREFLLGSMAAAAGVLAGSWPRPGRAAGGPLVVDVANIPVPDFSAGNHHRGVDVLLATLFCQGVPFYAAPSRFPWSDPATGLIARDDVVLIKVNGQWQYRGVTSSDVVRGVIQRVLDHPEGFAGEVVIVENGQSVGSLNCDQGWNGQYPTRGIAHANAEDESHSFQWLLDNVFPPAAVSGYLLDPIRNRVVAADDHATDGYRRLGNVSYPCFTTAGGRRVELREGVWDGAAYRQNLKLLNLPVFKHHGGSAITGALKHVYGLLSTALVGWNLHYADIGNATADMHTLVRRPALNIVDCIWVSRVLSGYPASETHRADRLLAGFDPVALDYYAGKHILFPWDGDPYHDPDRSADYRAFLTQARDRINQNGGIDGNPATFDESQFVLATADAGRAPSEPGRVVVSKQGGETRLDWQGGTPPFRVWRSDRPDFASPVLLTACCPVQTYVDAGTLGDGRSYYYRVETAAF